MWKRIRRIWAIIIAIKDSISILEILGIGVPFMISASLRWYTNIPIEIVVLLGLVIFLIFLFISVYIRAGKLIELEEQSVELAKTTEIPVDVHEIIVELRDTYEPKAANRIDYSSENV